MITNYAGQAQRQAGSDRRDRRADRGGASSCRRKAETDPKAVLTTYADIAQAKYEDALTTRQGARRRRRRADRQAVARQRWTPRATPGRRRASPTSRPRSIRFGNPIVDDWEGRVNAWPLDEGLIDYVDAGYGTESDENTLYTANVIANPSIEINGEKVDATKITPEFLSGTLQEAGDIEANVATGYHAIEFLLWGQDLNGTGPGAGNRPYTDYDTANCTGGNCDRRAAYLDGRDRPAGHRPRGDGRQLDGRRRGAQGAARRRRQAGISAPS